MNKSILIAALAVTLLPSAHAQTAPASSGVLSNLSVNGTLDLESQYIFRGKKVTNAALQPSANITYGNVAGGSITGYMWTSQPIGRAGAAAGPNENNEIDLGIRYDNTLPSNGAISYEVGAQMYWYPNKSGNVNWLSRSYELHVGVGYDTTDLFNNMGWGKYNVQPMLTYYHDLILDSNTLNLQVASYTFDLSDWSGAKGLSLTPTATIGWTGLNRADGDQDETPFIAGGFNGAHWSNSYIYYELDLELDYKPNNSGTTTFFTGVHYAGNNDGSGVTAFTAPATVQSPGSANSIWFGFGIKFNQ
jgi:hypothetical protein